MPTNPTRVCPICTQTDDHPRHIVPTAAGVDVAFHMDCHVLVADCDVCKDQLEGVGGVDGNPKGEALREHLVLNTGPAADLAGWTAPEEG
jgi:hypothetical protein